MNSATSPLCRSPNTIRKPDRAKNRLIPIAPVVSFNRRIFGPSGSMCAASTSKMLIALRPSRTGSLLAEFTHTPCIPEGVPERRGARQRSLTKMT